MSNDKYNPFADIEQQINAKPLDSELSSRPIKDTGIKLAQGAIDLGDSAVGVGDLLTGGRATGALQEYAGYDPERAKSILGDGLSAKQKQADQAVAESDGFFDALTTAIDKPRAITGTISQSLPLMLGGMGASAARAKAIYKKAADKAGGPSTAAGKAAGEKAVKDARAELIGTGSAVEGTQIAGLTAAEAEREGRDYSDYALPSVAAGIGTAAIGTAGGRLFGDAPTEVATKAGAGTKSTAKNSLARKGSEILKAGAVEGGEEMLQEGQEGVFGNIAMGEENLLEGVPEGAAMGLLAGAGMGTAFGAMQNLPNDPYSRILKEGEKQLARNNQAAAEQSESGEVTELPPTYTESPESEMPGNQPAAATPAPEPTPEPEQAAPTEPVKSEAAEDGEQDIILKTDGNPFRDETTAKRAATARKSKTGQTYEPVKLESGGYGLRVAGEFDDNARVDAVNGSDRINNIRDELNQYQEGLGDQTLTEASDSDMDEPNAFKYMKDRRKSVMDESLKASIGNASTNETGGLNEQQAQAETEEENTPETSGAQTGDVDPEQSQIDDQESESQENAPVNTKLPADISKAKPRYSYGSKRFTLSFDNDVDRAAYISAQNSKSKRDADYVNFAQNATGMSEAEVREHGARVRDSIKAQAKDAEPGDLRIADQRPIAAPSDTATTAPENVEQDQGGDATFTTTQPDTSNAFVPTHELPNGTPVAAVDGESNVFVDADGIEWEDGEATPLTQDFDGSANEAATSETNDTPEPTEAQKEAGNYKVGRVKVAGMDVSVENPKGSVRKGTDRDGNQWESEMKSHYGYFRGTVGKDKDHVDVFLTDDAEAADKAFVIDQVDPETREFDEHKVVIGPQTEADALKAYSENYDAGWDGAAAVTEMPMDEFKEWVANKAKTSKPAGDISGRQSAAEGGKQSAGGELDESNSILMTESEARESRRLGNQKRKAMDRGDGDAVDSIEQKQQALSEKIKARAKSDGSSNPEAANSDSGNAREDAQRGADKEQLEDIVSEFNEAAADMRDGDDQVHHLFDTTPKKDIVRLNNKAKVYHKEHGWMTPAEARAVIDSWKDHADAQAGGRQNNDRVVLSLFDLTGSWSQPWEDAGYQVFRFDIQNDPEMGDVNNFSTEFFGDWFGDFDGLDIYAVLAACPCTDFASSGSRHFAVKDADGRAVESVKLVQQTLATIEHFRPAVWAVENPVGRIEKLGGLPPWRLSFDPNHLGDPYTKKTLIWGRFNADLPVAPVEPTEGSKMHTQYGGSSQKTKNARSVTPEGFSYGFFMANNAIDHPIMAASNKYDRLDREVIADAINAGMTESDIGDVVDDYYYMDLDDAGAENALREAISERQSDTATSAGGPPDYEAALTGIIDEIRDNDKVLSQIRENGKQQAMLGELPKAVTASLTDHIDSLVDAEGVLSSQANVDALAGMVYDRIKTELSRNKPKAKDDVITGADGWRGDLMKQRDLARQLIDAGFMDEAQAQAVWGGDSVSELESLIDDVRTEQYQESWGREVDKAKRRLATAKRKFRQTARPQHQDKVKAEESNLRRYRQQVLSEPPQGWSIGQPVIDSTDQSNTRQENKSVNNQEDKAESADQQTAETASNQESQSAAIGKNPDGFDLYEDQNGVRYYVESGVEIYEPVGITPGTSSVDTPTMRRDAFKTDAEREQDTTEQPTESAPAEPEESAEPEAPTTSADNSAADEQPSAAVDKNSDEYQQAKDDLDAALGDLGEIFLNANLLTKKAVPTEIDAAQLMPVMTRVMGAAFRMGYAKFKENARFTLNMIRDRWGDAAADSIQVDDLQGAYIAMKQGTDSKLDVISVESIEEIMAESPEATNADNIETETSAEETADDSRSDDTGDQDTLDYTSPQSSGGLDTGGFYTPSESGGGSDTDGNAELDGDRTRPENGLVGSEDALLHNDATKPDGLASGPGGRSSNRPHKVSGENPGNFVITDELRLGEGTTKQKIDANLAAIKTLKTLESEQRFATPDEQKILAKYVGWGGIAQAFDSKNADATGMVGNAYRTLKEQLTESEWNAALSSTRNAHYTAKPVIDAMWSAAKHFGFNGGRVLEPTVGSGNFIGLQPAEMAASSTWFSAELDSITGGIAKHLYPESTVLDGTSFQDAKFADGVFDLAIGNPPFGGEAIRDKSRPELSGMKVHNYIISKSGQHLRPGGVMAFVVTHRFLDAANPEARNELAKDFNFIGAMRLPNDAFLKNAGTEVTTDIIFLQKRHAGDKELGDQSWVNHDGVIESDGQQIRVNQYFQNNPQNILGTSALTGSMYGDTDEYTVNSDGRDLQSSISKIIGEDWAEKAGLMKPTDGDTEMQSVMLSESDIPVGGMVLGEDGKIMARDLDDANGNSVVREVTPDSYLKEGAEKYDAIYRVLKKMADNDGKLTDADINTLNDNVGVAYLVSGAKKAKPTKYEQAVYDVMDAVADGSTTPWRLGSQLKSIEAAKNDRLIGRQGFAKLKALLGLRNKALDLIKAEFNNDSNIESLRKALNKAYDAFVEKNGYILDPENLRVLDGDYGIELGLESGYEPKLTPAKAKEVGEKPRPSQAQKSALLKHRVNYPDRNIEKAGTPKDALDISLSQRGTVDLGYMAKLTGQPVQSVIDELAGGDNPEIFYNPETDQYEHADEYLSGAVKKKLREAQDAGLKTNAKMLEQVQPAPKTRDQIKATIRSAWLPESIFTDFLNDLGVKGKAIVIESIGRVSAETATDGQLTELGANFKDNDSSVVNMFEHAASGKQIKVTRRHSDGSIYVDQEATARVSALVERMGKVFEQWLNADETRVAQIVETYNEKLNTHTERQFNGVKYLKPVGLNPNIELRNTQKNAAWRMILSANTLLDHVVGAGKTFTIVTGVMERRRLGLSRKPMVAVPNHLVVQWASEWYELYPSAKLLAATPDDFTPKNRRKLMARMATGDYDAIIIGHSTINKLMPPAADEEMVLNEQINLLKQAMDEAKEAGQSKRSVKQMGQRIDKLKDKIKKLREGERDDLGIDFAEMGVDYLSVDEAHIFKNLAYATAGERVVGMNDPNGSERAMQLYTLIRGLQNRGGGVNFATGTPLSNSLVELYTMMTYLATSELKSRNQQHFDAWSGAFTETAVRPEYTATQKLKPRRILSGLINLDSLRQLYMQFADVITMSDLKAQYRAEKEQSNREKGKNERTEFPVPKVKGGGRKLDSGKATASQKEYTDYLVARMNGIEENAGDDDYKSIDNALWVLSDARKMSLDIRTVDHEARRDEDGKVMRSARNIKAKYDEWNEQKGTQLVFSDLSTPSKGAETAARKLVQEAAGKIGGKKVSTAHAKKLVENGYREAWDNLMLEAEARISELQSNGQHSKADDIQEYIDKLEDAEATLAVADTGFSVYDDLREVLMDMGIPEREIAFIHDYNTPEQKKSLFRRVKKGQVRVLIGSTSKMGAGTNVQDRLVALHHLDAPWRPSDVEQREGRIIRQGNLFYEEDPDGFEVEITAYSTEGTADTVMWQILQRKAAGIEQFRNGELNEMQEDSADSDQYAEFMASSTGNPVFRLKMESERRARELEAEISGRQTSRGSAIRFLKNAESLISRQVELRDAFDGADIGDAEFDGITGSIDELNAAMDEAMAAYKTAYANYIEKKHTIEDQYEAAEAAGKSLDDLPNIPTPPSKPSIMRKSVQDKSGYARATAEFLSRAQDLNPGGSMKITIGDVTIAMSKSQPLFSDADANYYSMTAQRNGQEVELYQAAMKVPAASDNMVKALNPDTLAARVSAIPRRADNEIASLEQRLAASRKLVENEIDTTKVDEAKEVAEWFRIQQEFAEAEADRERGSYDNKYILADNTRRLSTGSKQSDTTKYDFELDGVKYRGTGISSGIKFDARRVSDDKKVIIEATTENDTKIAKSVAVEPELAGDMLASALAGKQSLSSRSESITNGLNMPAARKILGQNNLLNRLMKSGKLKVQRESSGRQGAYNKGVASVFANNNTADGIESVAWHEITHAAMDTAGDSFINPKVKQKLFNRLKREVDRVKKGGSNDLMARAIRRTESAGTPDDQYLEEIAAYLVTEYTSQPSSFSGSVLSWMRDMLAAIRTAILRHTGLMAGRPSAADMNAIARAYAGYTLRAGQASASDFSGSEGALYSTAAPDIDDIRQTIDRSALADDLKKPFARLWDGIKSQSMGALTLRQLGEVMSNTLPAIRDKYIPLKDALEVEIRKWQDIGGQIASDRRKLKKPVNQSLSELQHDATIEGVDPATTFKPLDVQKVKDKIAAIRAAQIGTAGDTTPDAIERIKALEEAIEREPRRSEAYGRLKKMWDALPVDAKDIYRRERSFHENLNKERLKALEEKVDRQPGSPSQKSQLMATLQSRFEAFEVNAPYFPLGRYGDYWVFAESPEGERTFNMFETDNERNRFKEQIGKEGYSVLGSGTQLDRLDSVDGVDPQFVREVDKMISQLGEGKAVQELRKQVYDLYLTSLPDLSARKHFIRRKKTKGFDEDQSRAFANAVNHGSRDIGRLKYADQMQSVIDNIQSTVRMAESDTFSEDIEAEIRNYADYLENAADLSKRSIAQYAARARGKSKAMYELWSTRLKIRETMTNKDVESEIHRLRQIQKSAEDLRGVGNITLAAYANNEIRKSHEAILNPNTHPVTQTLNSFGFFWFLGLTPAAAFVNLTQTAIIAMPLIGSKYSYAKANKHLKNATSEFFSKGGELDGFSVLNNTNLSDDERRAFRVFYGEGLIDNTLAHDTAGIAEDGVNTGSLRHKMMDAASYMFHHAERMNREVTALAAYRSAREAGENHETATASAADIVWNGHFDYTSTNRARFLRGNVMRVVTQFKQYSQNMLYLYGRLGYQALRGSGMEKTEARKALTGIIAMQFGLAGAAGLPLAGLFMGVAQLLADIGGDDDDPFLLEPELRAAVTRALTDVLGDDAGRVASNALTNGVVNAFTPINLAGRISHNDLIVRTSDRELEGRNAAYDTMKAIGGVPTSYIEMPFVAVEHLRNENYSKAAETMLPKFARDVIKAMRYGTEDARTGRGYLFKEMNMTEVAAQMVGFSSSDLIDQYKQNTARYNLEGRLKDRRRKIMDRMVRARAGDGSESEARSEMRAWNNKNPQNPITIQNIMQSERGRRRYQNNLNDGKYTTDRYRDIATRFDWVD